MLRAKRPMLASILASALVITSTLSMPVFAAGTSVEHRPGEMAMIGDAFIARPALLASTAIGFGFFVATLPISALGGNVPEAANALVGRPASAAFLRCLGCTLAQHESLRAKRKTEQANRNMQKQNASN